MVGCISEISELAHEHTRIMGKKHCYNQSRVCVEHSVDYYMRFIPPSPSFRLCLQRRLQRGITVVLTSRIHSTVKYNPLGQSVNIYDVSRQPTRTLYMWKKLQWQQTKNIMGF